MEGRSAPARATVLLVEDDAAVSELYRIGLEAAGYRVVLATDGHAAMDRVAEDPPDILVLDLRLPRLDGLGVLTAVRGRPASASLPVLLLSNHADRPIVERAFRLGAQDFLVKMHTTPSALALEVGRWLARVVSTRP